jgi:N-methylhydantoinase A
MLEEQLRPILKSEGVKDEDISFVRTAFFRYRRQINEIAVTAPIGKLGPHDVDRWIDDFEALYERLYGKGTAFREAGIEIVTFRVAGVGKIPKPVWRRYDRTREKVSQAVIAERDVFYWGQNASILTKVYDEAKLGPGHEIDGPAIIRHEDTTVVIGPAQKAYIDQYRNVIMS